MEKGIPAKSVHAFLDALLKNRVNMHGFLMIRGGKILAEGYWAPFDRDTPHRMYSIGKSFTALAIGMLEGEGKLSLDDPITRYFPEYLPNPLPGPIARMTIRDMLRMATAHNGSTYKRISDDHWTRTFFTVPPAKEPGMVFDYDTSATHTLSALVQKLTGQPLDVFLTKRLFAPLGLAGHMHWLKDPVGICQGGSGLVLTLRDLGRVALCCLRGGEGLVPEEFLHKATRKQIETPLQTHLEEQYGYGYQFWRIRREGFAMYGMGGQLAVCLPEEDLVVCTMADTQLDPDGVQKIYDALFDHALPLINEGDEGDEDRKTLNERLASLKIPAVANDPSYAVWPKAVFQFSPNALGIQSMEIVPNVLRYSKFSGEHELRFGIGELVRGFFPGTMEPCYTSAGWIDEGVLCLVCHVIGDEPGVMRMTLCIRDGHLTVQLRSVQTPYFEGYSGVASSQKAQGKHKGVGTMNIRDFDQLAENNDWTQAFKGAVDALCEAGGGTLFVPAGRYDTGPIELKSGITLHLDAGAVLRFYNDPEIFPLVDMEFEGISGKAYMPLVFARDAHHVRVTGDGLIDGNGSAWWALVREKKLCYPRPYLVCFMSCRDVIIDHVTLVNSPSWTVHPLYCDHVTISHVTIRNPSDSPNTDGIDPDGSSNVRITDCLIDVGDDCIAIKSGTEDTKNKQPCENILISGCHMLSGHGGVVVGSEMSGSVRNVQVSNCIFKGTDRGIRIKTRRGRGGVVENLMFSHILMEDVLCPFVFNMYYFCGKDGKLRRVWDKDAYPLDDTTPVLRDIVISDVTVNGASSCAGFLYGLAERPVERVRLRDVTVIMRKGKKDVPAMMDGIAPMEGKGFYLRNGQGICFDHVTILGADGVSVEDDTSVQWENPNELKS